MSLRYPLIAWGTADDLSAYDQFGTCGVTGSVTDPFGGSGAFTLDDTDGANTAYRYKGALVFTQSLATIGVFAKAGIGTQSIIRLFDDTAGAAAIRLDLAWSGGVPTVTLTTGTLGVAIACGGGWYFIIGAGGVARGNSHSLELRPATTNAAATGTTSFYVQNMVLLDYLDTAVAYDQPREGSEQVQSPSGVEDAWTVGTDEMLKCNVKAVPADPRSTPAIVSGWYGTNESTGVNCGVKAMLKQGRDKQVLRFVPDRSVCTTYMDSYLVEPMSEAPGVDTNPGDRTFPMTLRGSSVYTGY